MKVLAEEADGVKFGCLNDLDVGADGTIYFTEASSKFPMSQFTNDLLEHQPNGRLLALDPTVTPATDVVARHLLCEWRCGESGSDVCARGGDREYRVRRVWIKEPKMGQNDIFIDNLPGFPDGISSNGRDRFWLALVTPRQAIFDRMLPYPFDAEDGRASSQIPATSAPALLIRPWLRPSRPRRRKPPERLPRLLRRNRQRRRTQRHPLLRQHRRRHRRPLPSQVSVTLLSIPTIAGIDKE